MTRAAVFKTEGGDCSNVRHMAEAAQIFDPIFLSNIRNETDIVLTLHYLADKLSYFGYDRHFTPRFYTGLKSEMSELVREAKRYHNLDEIKPTRQYKTRLQKHIKKNNMSAAEVDWNWKDDAGEYAERIWQWWKPETRRTKFPFHALALRLIVLTQLSS